MDLCIECNKYLDCVSVFVTTVRCLRLSDPSVEMQTLCINVVCLSPRITVSFPFLYLSVPFIIIVVFINTVFCLSSYSSRTFKINALCKCSDIYRVNSTYIVKSVYLIKLNNTT